MKKTFLTVALLLCFANGAFAAQAAITQIPALGASASIKDLRDATNTRLSATQSNFTEIYTALNGSPWLAQTTAPNIHNVFWIDTSAATRVVKYWDGDSWEVAASGGDGTYTLPTASTETKGGVKIGARLTMTGEVLSADVQTTDISGKEDSLGSPSANGYVLSSTTAGVRSWVEMTGGGTGIAHAPSDGNYYASRNGAWENLAGVFVATETDPVFSAWDKDYADLINTPTIPTALSGFTDDDTHRLVTDTEKSTWNAKQSALVAGTDYLSPTGSAANLTGFPASLATDAEVVAGYQPLDADLTDLADGSLTGAKIGTGIDGGNISTGTVADARIDAAIARDTEVTAAINALPTLVFGTGLTTSTDTPSAGTDTVSVTANTYQAYDLDLTTWAGITPGTGVAAFIASPSGGNLATALTTALPASKGGTGLNAIGTGVPTALGINTGAVGGLPTIIASGAYTVDTASISANTCASAVAVTASGVATTDTIIATPNAILSTIAGFGVTTAGAVRVDIYPTSGNVNFQFCNPTGAAINPGSVTFNWKVVR